jgi:hypothetical protein
MEAKVSKQNLGWGILLICFGLVAMMDIYFPVSDWIDLSIFFVGGLITLIIFLMDRSDWTVLIPAYVMLALAVIGAVAIWELVEGDLVGTVVLTLVALPFLVVYIRNRENWWAIIPSFILLAIALILFLTSFVGFNDDIIGPLVLFAIAIPFLVVYFRNKKENWWALIPAYVMIVIGALIGLTEVFNVDDDIIGPSILFAIAIPFLVVYFINRENWWALIPAYAMIVIGTMVGLIETDVLGDLLIPAYIMLAIAIPFFVVYFRNNENWWALIPGGITGLIGLGFLISEPAGRFLAPAALIIAGAWLLLRQTKKG